MGEINSRHRGIEAIFHHMERGVYMKVVFHTPATYSQSTEMKKAMSEHFSSQITGKGGGADNLKRQQVRRPTTLPRVCKTISTLHLPLHSDDGVCGTPRI